LSNGRIISLVFFIEGGKFFINGGKKKIGYRVIADSDKGEKRIFREITEPLENPV
jgi:hypothetical protein